MNKPPLSVVIIGRNEGQRLVDCIRSVQNMNDPPSGMEIIYVDSDSTDGSVDRAKALGTKVLVVHPERPAAAIGRNAGWRAAKAPLILFLDGDTILHPDFVKEATQSLDNSPKVAIVWGHFKKKTDTLITHIGRSPTNRKKMAVVEDGKLAITTYEVIEELNMLSLIRLKLGTGRTHQIRVHMAAIGHPVFADYVYGGKSKKLSSLSAAQRSRAAHYLEILNRQALHAKTLGFLHPVTKKWLQFDSEIPQDMQQLIYAAQR